MKSILYQFIKRRKDLLVSGGLIVILSLALVWLWRYEPSRGPIKPVRCGALSYRRDFNDLQDKHERAAKKIGIRPFNTRKEAGNSSQDVQKITSNKYFHVRRLTHSVPYVVPEVATFLDDLGKRFRTRLKQLNAPLYKFEITSVTRTEEDVRNLRRINANASANSVHMYGTTIDISWSQYDKVNAKDKRSLSDSDLKKVLALALKEMKSEGLCYIKHEVKQACFHITVIK